MALFYYLRHSWLPKTCKFPSIYQVLELKYTTPLIEDTPNFMKKICLVLFKCFYVATVKWLLMDLKYQAIFFCIVPSILTFNMCI